MNKVIIGLGTGRCGTTSLYVLLNKQGIKMYHEMDRIKWEGDTQKVLDNIFRLVTDETTITGDVGFYYLNYVEDIIKTFPNAIFICLKRNREDTINSWYKHALGRNYWTKRNSEHWGDYASDVLEQYMPKYDLPKKEAIGQYYDDYYKKAEELTKYPQFRIFDMDYTLNTDSGQMELFNFIGLKNYEIIKSKYNKQGDVIILHQKMEYKSGMCEFCKTPESAEWYIIDKSNDIYSYACDECERTDNLGLFKNREVICL